MSQVRPVLERSEYGVTHRGMVAIGQLRYRVRKAWKKQLHAEPWDSQRYHQINGLMLELDATMSAYESAAVFSVDADSWGGKVSFWLSSHSERLLNDIEAA